MTRRAPLLPAALFALATGLAVVGAASATAAPPAGEDEVRAPAPDEPGPGITTDEFAARRRALVRACGEGAVVLLGGKPGNDLEEYFQASDFYYLTGINEAGPAALLRATAEGGYEEVLFLPGRNRAKEQWDGPRLYPGEAAQRATGFASTASRSMLTRTAQDWSRGARSLWLVGLRRDEAPDGLPEGLDVRSAASRVAELRQVKSAAEVAIFQRAVDITSAALMEAMKSAAPGQGEWELEGVIEYVFRRHGAERFGFPSIVGSGPNSVVLHYNANTRRMQPGELVVCDVGAEYRRYTADVTRTFPVSGKFTPRQREIYQIVLRAQNEAMKAVRPGATLRQVHAVAARVIREAGHGSRFFHGTSHWIGLDVHDVGAYDRPLEPGMILSVEPGIYIAEENLGVRIEDDVLVTEDGFKNLSEACPRDPDAIEALMAERGVGKVPVASPEGLSEPWVPSKPTRPEPAPQPKRRRAVY